MTNAPFIPAWLDDFGLTPIQFRVYCHICRRDPCFASLDAIAKTCKIYRRTAQRAIKDLLALKLVEKQFRFGSTSVIRPSDLFTKLSTDPKPRPFVTQGVCQKAPRGRPSGAHIRISPKGTPLKGPRVSDAQRIIWEKELDRIEERLPGYNGCQSQEARTRAGLMRDRRSHLRVLLGVQF